VGWGGGLGETRPSALLSSAILRCGRRRPPVAAVPVRTRSNCVAVRRGGEQRKRTRSTAMTDEHDSATVAATSLLGNGEVCVARATQPPRLITDARREPAGVVGGGRSGKERTCKSRRPRREWPEFMVAIHPKNRRRGVRAPIVAWKRGNARGAKGCRKVGSVEGKLCKTSRYRLPCGARKPVAKEPTAEPEADRMRHRKEVPGAVPQGRPASRRMSLTGENCQLESRVRENCTHGLEGGATQVNASSLPLSEGGWFHGVTPM